MTDDRRRYITAEALRSIDVEIEVRRAELAAIERARDVLERSQSERPDQCTEWRLDSPCYGLIHARWCRACGETWRRCESHGGIRAATHDASIHRGTHGDGWGVAESATDSIRLRERAEAMPLGRLPSSPATRDLIPEGKPRAPTEPAHGGRIGAAIAGVHRRRKDR